MGATSSFDSPVENTDTKKKLTAAEIIAIMEAKGVSESDFGHSDFDVEELGLGPIEEVHHEREGSEFDCIVKVGYFENHDVYIAINGYYSSQEGSTFDGNFHEVKPETQTITVYKSVK